MQIKKLGNGAGHAGISQKKGRVGKTSTGIVPWA